MLTATDLLPFTSRERTRPYLRAPFVLGDHTYACNGHIACRIPGRHVEAECDAKAAAISGIFDVAFARPLVAFEPVVAETRRGDVCRDCSGGGVVVDCGVCGGSGEHACSDDLCRCTHECGGCSGVGALSARRTDAGAYDCDACEGTGRQIDASTVDLGDGLAMQWRYLQRVQALPGPITWSVPEPTASVFASSGLDYAMVAFSGPGWQAIIMPCRSGGAVAIQAQRHTRGAVAEPAPCK